jgi:uncharacterized coiled-coil DUF342 family protein
MRTKASKPQLSQKERVDQAMARAGTLRDKIETARRSANEVRAIARGLKAELKETINLMNAIHRQMKELYESEAGGGLKKTLNSGAVDQPETKRRPLLADR